ncbi:NADPH-dependent 7-cyano-7-deazaguanine reductase [Anaerobiospirillum thomasii]|uniref:preQ(1) synthase n=1 Tax=Anaerobiospirillum thomasii TaxID=179995 RepID=UPI000D984772|nr:preQ(1) synthase [Anaerobiospirillum thomasii]SPT71455.1 NADPH-dependent 7-cyano-7-deazaguanine reductase [Anaerobiospirillum thomasii]
MELTHLGHNSRYYSQYNPSLLEPIMRHLPRAAFSTDTSIGYDLWRLYEITYLNARGIPCIVMGSIKINAASQFTVESKSLKLYIGSFTNTKFLSLSHVKETIERDLHKVTASKVEVELYPPEDMSFMPEKLPGICIDDSAGDIKLDFDTINPTLLKYSQSDNDEDKAVSSRTYHSNIVRTLCPVTSQPDFASVVISYTGRAIDTTALFAYLCSYRHHQGFHEACTENIYNDLKNVLNPDGLCVAASFTRRGGIDINPCRADSLDLTCKCSHIRTLRQ